MRYALISDIHANLPALEAVLDDIEARRVDATYHLGDLVGYAPWPNEVVALLDANGIGGVAGNYDSTVATDYPHCGCKYEDPQQEALSHLSYDWTRRHVSAETKRRLGELPFRIDLRPEGGHAAGPTLALVHGAPTLNTLYWTEDRSDDFCLKMARLAGLKPGDAIAFGHTHKPWYRTVGSIHFINTGSVGRPKDGDWRAGYVLLELDASAARVEFVRVTYDVERAARAIRESDLPDEFAAYLRTAGSFTIRPAASRDLDAVKGLLDVAHLPLDGLEEQFGEGYAVAVAGNEIVGAEGIEVYARSGLLRSAVVHPEWRGRGVGDALTRDRIEWARRAGLDRVYLLTTTAESYFPRFGFARVDRAEAPQEIRESREFAGACPATAALMVLRVAGSG
jgi:N-acetylglutamate synthase-like GNAT family acetyltransferase/predicted phosphodiesterase